MNCGAGRGRRVGHWLFNDGNDTVAVDSTNYAHDITLSGATWGPGVGSSGLRFDGGGSARTNDAVLYTDQSFTVDVWAELDATGAPGTVVAQRRPSDVDPFTLQVDSPRGDVRRAR